MKKILRSKLFSFILGAIIFSTMTAYAVTIIGSEEISFTSKDSNWNVNTVEEALDELYIKFPYDRYIEKTTITPNENTQTLLTKDKVLKNDMIINPIPETYKILTDDTTVTESNMLKGVKAYDKDGNLITGNISTKCISGSFVCGPDCAGSTGQVVVSEFAPSEFMLFSRDYWISYYNKEFDPLYIYTYYIGSIAGIKDQLGYKHVINNNMFIVSNFGSNSLNKTFYYIACK